MAERPAMTRKERLRAAVRRQPVDRVPYAVWRHFPAVDRSPAGLAQATLRFHDRYGSDFLKLTPPSGWTVQAWGCVEAEEAAADGQRGCVRCAILGVDDWRRIRPLDPASAPGWVDQIETIVRIGFDRRLADAPVLATLLSPLSLARKLAGDRLATDLRDHPDIVEQALEAITETLLRFADLALTEGVSGTFYVIQAGSLSLHSEEEYLRFGEPYDRRVLAALGARSVLTIVHAHGSRLMFPRLAALPADAWSWADRQTPPSLCEAQAIVRGAVVGGLDQWRTLRDGTPEQAVAEVKDAILATEGLGLVVAPGCVVPPNTPDNTIAAVVRTLGGPLTPVLGVVR